MCCCANYFHGKAKVGRVACRVRPRRGHEGLEEKQSRSSILSLTSALDGVDG